MFGVFVTTSFFNPQAYDEVRSDGHPLVLISGRDIVDVLRSHGYTTVDLVRTWLAQQFPTSALAEGALVRLRGGFELRGDDANAAERDERAMPTPPRPTG
jgi:hypothetical protein